MTVRNRKPRQLPSFERLAELLKYDPETGIFRWKVSRRGSAKEGSVAGRISSSGHREISVDGHQYPAHRLAWLMSVGAWPAEQIDHINRRPDDNRLVNLREASRAENMWNSSLSCRNTSGFKGVTFFRRAGKWMARIKFNGQSHFLGLFTTAEEAHAAYCKAAEKCFGEFAHTGTKK